MGSLGYDEPDEMGIMEYALDTLAKNTTKVRRSDDWILSQ